MFISSAAVRVCPGQAACTFCYCARSRRRVVLKGDCSWASPSVYLFNKSVIPRTLRACTVLEVRECCDASASFIGTPVTDVMALKYAIAPLLSTAQECSIIFIRIYVCSSFPATLHEADDDNRLERMNGRISAVV